MKKIIYLHIKKEVKIGDTIIFNGMSIEVSDKLIKNNPDIFEVKNEEIPEYFKCISASNDFNFTLHRIYKQAFSGNYPRSLGIINDKGNHVSISFWNSSHIGKTNVCFEPATKEEFDKQELLDKAKRDFPVGTVYKHFNSEYTTNSPDMLTVSAMNHHFSFGTSIWVTSEEYNGIVYEDGEWAEILPLKFTTEDGVDIYGDMKTYKISKTAPKLDDFIRSYNWTVPFVDYGYFYHKENALAYIEKHKEKSLDDYENILSERGNSMICSSGVVYPSVYGWLKYNEPKLYYTKILQLIADDLNDGWVADFTDYNEKWYLKKKSINYIFQIMVQGVVYFKTMNLAQKAKDILGDKAEYLFN